MNYKSKWSSTNPFPYPTVANLLKLNADSIKGLTESLCNSVEINELNDFGQLSFAMVIILLTQISEKMQKGQTLEDFLKIG